MLLGTIIPIVKNKQKSISDSSNFRAITFSSILGKMFDNIIPALNSSILSSSNYQFGFKPKHSTVNCSFVLKEIAQNYNNKGSNVYCLLLDRVFRRVHYIKLFKLLIEKGMCYLTARFLLSSCIEQHLRVKWKDRVSTKFSVKNGVKQGGVLSLILFAVYIDELLNRLKMAGYGCYIGNIFCGALAYADDVTILGPSLMSLNLLLDVVKKFGDEYYVLFNASKTKLIKFGNS